MPPPSRASIKTFQTYSDSGGYYAPLDGFPYGKRLELSGSLIFDTWEAVVRTLRGRRDEVCLKQPNLALGFTLFILK